MTKPVTRCKWAEGVSLDYIEYHDMEWGVPVHDDRVQFEFLLLEGAQAGLSWSTILNKREGYRKAFADFDPVKVARFTDKRVEKLLLDPSIVRNRLKVNSAVTNAKAFLAVQKEFGSFSKYIWEFVGGKPIQNRFKRTPIFLPRRRSPMRSARTSRNAASSSLAVRSSTPTCRQPVSSTITSSGAFVISPASSLQKTERRRIIEGSR